CSRRERTIRGRSTRGVVLALVGVLALTTILIPLRATASGVYDSDDGAASLDETAQWTPFISSVSKSTGVPRQILRAIVMVESGGDAFATSDEIVAFGLMLATKEIEAQSSLE